MKKLIRDSVHLRAISSFDAQNRPSAIETSKNAPPNDDLISKFTQQNYEVHKRHTPGPGDTIFDETAVRDYVAGVVGTRINILTFPVPAQQSLIIQKYIFFVIVDNSPATPAARNVLAGPFEYMNNFRFYLSGNSVAKMKSLFFVTLAGPVLVYNDGFVTLSQDPERDSDPNYGAVVVPFEKGSLLEINLEYTGALNLITQRLPLYFGARLRGFLTPRDITKGQDY